MTTVYKNLHRKQEFDGELFSLTKAHRNQKSNVWRLKLDELMPEKETL